MRFLCAALLFASIVTLCACGSSSKDEQDKPPPPKPGPAELQEKAAELAKKRDTACGNPVRYPVSDECLQLAANDAPILRKANELTIAVWRSCALTPASAEAIRRETIARGSANTEMGKRIISEMERTERDSDSPCVRADMSDPDCIAGDMDACSRARSNDKACLAWFHDPDTQKRIECLSRSARNAVCVQAASAETGSGSDGGYFSDAQQLADDCRRAQNACLHTFDECADAKDALDKFLAQVKGGAKPGTPGKPAAPQPQTARPPQAAGQ